MVSEMLKQHPMVLSLSELFSNITDSATRNRQAFPEGVIDASQFWSILSTPCPKHSLLDRYARFKQKPRIMTEAGIPPLARITLPFLTSKYDTLFAEIEVFVASLPPALVGQHYRSLFSWLQYRFKRQIWVERSGGSLEFVLDLYRAFPDARFIHIVRDGRDAAISSSKHQSFRLLMLTLQIGSVLGVDPFESKDRSNVASLSEELRVLLPEYFDMRAFMKYSPPLSGYGHLWSNMITKGLHALSKIPSERVLTLQYESFHTDPATTVRKLISFVGPTFVNERWIRSVVSMIHPARSSWQTLPPEQQKQLNDACLPGFEALQTLHLAQN
jgi:putative sulfotransferase